MGAPHYTRNAWTSTKSTHVGPWVLVWTAQDGTDHREEFATAIDRSIRYREIWKSNPVFITELV